MADGFMTMSIYFVGMAIGSLTPTEHMLGWIIPMSLATLLMFLSLWFNRLGENK